MSQPWTALVIGNSRLHWAQFSGDKLQQTWNTPHLSKDVVDQLIEHRLNFAAAALTHLVDQPLLAVHLESPELWIASVVPEQTQHWQRYPFAQVVTLEQVPLQGMYPTFGLDRALAVWGAIATVGSPVLVVDAGTALTFTGANEHHQLVGGAILPGLRLQFQALDQSTAALPHVQPSTTEPLPPRWAMNTVDAIASGVIYTVLAGLHAFIQDWWRQFPESAVVLTGGDGDRLHHYLQQIEADPERFQANLTSRVLVDPSLAFWGMRAIRENAAKPDVID